MKIASRISRIEASKTLQVKEKALELKAKGLKVIDLTAGEPDAFPTPDFICGAGIEAIRQGFTKYTANNGIPELRKRICEKLKTENGLEYTPEQIIVSSGAKQSILNALLAILDEGDEVILPSPYWVSYPEQVKIAGCKPVVVDTSHHAFKITPQILAMKITEKTRAFILNSPCNPTGVIYSREELFLAVKELGPEQVEIVVPSVSILAEPPVTVVDKVALRKGTRDVADAYLKYIRNHVEPQDAEAKKQGLILDYKTFVKAPRDANDFDVMFCTAHANYGKALDYNQGDADKMKAIAAAHWATADEDKQAEMTKPRLEMRTFVGTTYLREVTLRPAN